MWYIATLVPLGVQRILFLPGSSKGLLAALDYLPAHFNMNRLLRIMIEKNMQNNNFSVFGISSCDLKLILTICV